MKTLLFDILIFGIPCWVTNMTCQIIGAYVTRLPQSNRFRSITLSNPDFIFIDGRPFFGGFKMLNYITIAILPFLFDIFNDNIFQYFLICTLAIIGDTLGSIVKRRLSVPSGKFLPIIDHGDYILTVGITFFALNYISAQVLIGTLLITYLIHPAACLIGYKLKIKNTYL